MSHSLIKFSTLPEVQHYKKGDDYFDTTTINVIIWKSEKNYDTSPIEYQLKKFALNLQNKFNKNLPFLVTKEEADIKQENAILIEKEAGYNLEEYKINIGNIIHIKYSNDRGLYYAVLTLQQLMNCHDFIPRGEIIDYPSIPERCLMLDMGRKFYTKEWILNLIDYISYIKINKLQLHFSENEGFRIESERHPEIMSDEYLTKQDIKEIIKYANDNFIDVIPDIDSPGHLNQVLSNHVEYQLVDNKNIRNPKALDITNPKAVDFIKSIITEYAELFNTSTVFHIGGDEFINFGQVGKYPSLVEQARKKYGAKATGMESLVDYTNDIAEHVKNLGFKPRVWNDPYYRTDKGSQVELSKDIAVTYWTHYDRNMSDLKVFIDKGHDVINFNDAYFYYVLGENAGYKYPKAEKIYRDWDPGLFPAKFCAKQKLSYPYPQCLVGASFAIWSDKPTAQTEQQVFEGIYEPIRAMAQKSWKPFDLVDSTSYGEFVKNNKIHLTAK